MSEWIAFVKQYAEKNNLKYRDALNSASEAYKNRNNIPPDTPSAAVTSLRPVEPLIKPKRQYNKKIKENVNPPTSPIEDTKPRKTYAKKR